MSKEEELPICVLIDDGQDWEPGRCGNCKWFFPLKVFEETGEMGGECRAHSRPKGGFPVTISRLWCGEWAFGDVFEAGVLRGPVHYLEPRVTGG